METWLSALPTFSCPKCGKETIFQDGCTDCLQREQILERLNELPREILAIEVEIRELTLKHAKLIAEQFELNLHLEITE